MCHLDSIGIHLNLLKADTLLRGQDGVVATLEEHRKGLMQFSFKFLVVSLLSCQETQVSERFTGRVSFL